MTFFKFTIFLALVCYCQGHPKAKLIGGSLARKGAFPYVAGVIAGRIVDNYFNASNACGGAIIHERWVLTAGHCVQKRALDTVFIINVGSNTLTQPAATYDAEEVFTHRTGGFFNIMISDIGLVKTVQTIQFNKFVQPIALPQSNPIGSGVTAKIAGWGKIMVDGVKKDILDLHEIELTVQQQVKCTRTFPYATEKQICTLNGKGKGLCTGDSGSPLVYNRAVIGIASYIYPNQCALGYPDVYTNVYAFLDWIHEKTNNEV